MFQGTVAYYLLLDNRFRVSSGYLGAEFQETVVCIPPFFDVVATTWLENKLSSFKAKD